MRIPATRLEAWAVVEEEIQTRGGRMSRQVVSSLDIASRDLEHGAQPGPAPLASPMGEPMSEVGESAGPGASGKLLSDDYRSRLVKYIPAEVIAVYVTLAGILAADPDAPQRQALFWVVFIVLLLLTPVYLSRVEGVKKNEQLVISTASFFVWVFAIGGPFAGLAWYDAIYGALALPLFTFAVPLWEAKA
jgi:hypothetical protein